MKPLIAIGILVLVSSCSTSSIQQDKSNFKELKEVIPDLVYDIRYYSADNFVGKPIDGYNAPKAYLTKEATAALQKVQAELRQEDLGLKIYDAYRPQRAVDHFVRWGQDPNDTVTKQQYYPGIDKDSVFAYGYVATQSSHTRGSTVDLTIINLKTGEELDMGSPWDFFGAISNHDAPLVTAAQTANRHKLRQLMEKHGFKEYPQEWWHYTLKDEPYPDTYFDWVVE
jgi:D-alanyl-D-alanine dipeptidase